MERRLVDLLRIVRDYVYRWLQLLFGEALEPQERSVIRESLLAYCKQDTWAMVRLLQRLRDLAIGG